MGLVDDWHLISDYHLSMQFKSLSRPPHRQSQPSPSHHPHRRPSWCVTSFLSYMCDDDDGLRSLTFLTIFCFISLSDCVFVVAVTFLFTKVLLHALKVSCFTYWQTHACTPSFSFFYTVPFQLSASPLGLWHQYAPCASIDTLETQQITLWLTHLLIHYQSVLFVSGSIIMIVLTVVSVLGNM